MREINTQNKRFIDGNGRDVLGTVVTADWLNAVQDELVSVIKGFGGEVNHLKPNQVYLEIKKVLDSKLGSVGDQKITNGMVIIDRPSAWEKLRMTTKNGRWRLETDPEGYNDTGHVRINFVFNTDDNVERGRIAFPAVVGTDAVAYQKWVQDTIAAAQPANVNAVDLDKQVTPCFFTNPTASGSLPARGDLAGLVIGCEKDATQLLTSAGAMFVRGADANPISNASDWGSWRRVLDDTNGVMLSGSQTIDGEKTFNSRTYHNGGVTVSSDGGKSTARFGANTTDTHLGNMTSNKYLQLKNDGSLAYSDDPILLQSSLSNATNNASTTTPASVAGVKTAYDKAVAAETAAAQAAPSGAVAFFAGATAPAGWLKANGAAVSRTTYADLFRAIGTTYGAGNGSTTFNLPDLRGEFVRGFDDGRKVDSGRALGSAQSDAIRNITGQLTTYRRTDRDYLVMPNGAFAMKERVAGCMGDGGRDDWAMTVDFDASKVVPTAVENRPRNIALLACIKI